MKIPVVFLHVGEQDYFADAINIAGRKNQVYVLGNQTGEFLKKINKGCNVSFYNIQKYSLAGELFKSVYEHFHSGAVPQQVICYVRWFMIRNFMIESDISAIFHADSDLAVLSDMTEVYKARAAPNLALMTQSNQPDYRWVASGHGSFWSIKAMCDFCDYTIESYQNPIEKQKLQEKYRWHLANNVEGGVCDMTQLYLFSRNYKTQSLSLVWEDDNSCFDDNVNSSENYNPDEYEMQYGIKKILSNKDSFYFVTKNNKSILTHTIHCQGVATKPFLTQIANYLRSKCE